MREGGRVDQAGPAASGFLRVPLAMVVRDARERQTPEIQLWNLPEASKARSRSPKASANKVWFKRSKVLRLNGLCLINRV